MYLQIQSLPLIGKLKYLRTGKHFKFALRKARVSLIQHMNFTTRELLRHESSCSLFFFSIPYCTEPTALLFCYLFIF